MDFLYTKGFSHILTKQSVSFPTAELRILLLSFLYFPLACSYRLRSNHVGFYPNCSFILISRLETKHLLRTEFPDASPNVQYTITFSVWIWLFWWQQMHFFFFFSLRELDFLKRQEAERKKIEDLEKAHLAEVQGLQSRVSSIYSYLWWMRQFCLIIWKKKEKKTT